MLASPRGRSWGGTRLGWEPRKNVRLSYFQSYGRPPVFAGCHPMLDLGLDGGTRKFTLYGSRNRSEMYMLWISSTQGCTRALSSHRSTLVHCAESPNRFMGTTPPLFGVNRWDGQPKSTVLMLCRNSVGHIGNQPTPSDRFNEPLGSQGPSQETKR